MLEITQQVSDVLRDYGLTRLQINVYVALLRLDEATPAQIARACKIHRVEGYRILKELTELGLVYQKLSSKRGFSAVNPRSMLSNLVSLKAEELKNLRKKGRDLIPLLESFRKDLHDDNENPSNSEARFRITLGERQSREIITRLWRQAKKELLILIPKGDFQHLTSNLRLISKWFGELSNKGVDIKILVDPDSETANILGSVAEKCKIRCLEQILFHMTIVDGSQILLGSYSGIHESRSPAFLWTDSLDFINSTSRMFEELWKNSFSYEERLIALRTGLPVERTEVVRGKDEIERLLANAIHHSEKRLFIALAKGSENIITDLAELTGKLKDPHTKVLIEIDRHSRVSLVDQLLDLAEVRHCQRVPFTALITDREAIVISRARVSVRGAEPEEGIWIRSRNTVDQFYNVANNAFKEATSAEAKLLEIRTGITGIGEGFLRQLGSLKDGLPQNLEEQEHEPDFTTADTRLFKRLPGVTYFISAKSAENKLEAAFAVVDPKASTPKYFHAGEEVTTVLQGTLEVHVGESAFTLNEGDTLQFSSRTPHSWRNPGNDPVKAFTVSTPPSFFGKGAPA